MNGKVVVIGAGHVGAISSYALIAQGICSEIAVIDRDKEKENSQVKDLADCVSLMRSNVKVYSGSYKDCEDAAVIVVAIGCPRKPGQTRLDVMADSLECAKNLVRDLKEISIPGIVITITNPADIIADFMRKELQMPRERLFSTGTSLDTARMKRIVADLCNVDPHSVVGYTMGEHGDSSMIAFSHLSIWGKPLAELKKECPKQFGNVDEKYVLEQTHLRGMDIINGKGSTEFGIGSAVADMVKAILLNEHRMLLASPLLLGEYGQEGVHAGVPCLIGANGIEKVIELLLSEAEREAFAKSCEVIRSHIVK